MKENELTMLAHGSYAVALPGVILVFDFHDDPAAGLSQMLSRNPGVPVVFLCTQLSAQHFNPQLFSLADNRNRTFVLSPDIPAGVVPDGFSVSRLSPGDFMPDMPGGVSVTAVGRGYAVQTPDHGPAVLYLPALCGINDSGFTSLLSDLSALSRHFDLGILPEADSPRAKSLLQAVDVAHVVTPDAPLTAPAQTMTF